MNILKGNYGKNSCNDIMCDCIVTYYYKFISMKINNVRLNDIVMRLEAENRILTLTKADQIKKAQHLEAEIKGLKNHIEYLEFENRKLLDENQIIKNKLSRSTNYI